jgi:predicted Zn-dependent protease
MKRFLPVLFTLSATVAYAQPVIISSPAYRECTALAASNPTAALAKAEEWLKIDQSIAARHCRAMALFGLSRFEDAAQALTDVRNSLGPEHLSLRIYVTHQVSRAWASANRPDAAIATLTNQLDYMSSLKGMNATVAPLSAELLLARAKLNENYGKLRDASADLDHAISLTPLNPDLLLERAGVFEQLGDGQLAKLDAESALKLRPGDAKAQAILARGTRAGAAPAPAAEATATAPTAVTAAPVTPVASASVPAPVPAKH